MSRKYEFCAEELYILREALAEYKHALTPPENASENRKRNYAMCRALLEQIVADVRLMRP
jgi:hypothetical protein